MNDNDHFKKDDLKKVDLKRILSNKAKDTIVEKKVYKLSNDMKELMEMVDNESNSTINKTWVKLNKKNKYELLEDFVERESIEKELNDKDKIKLSILLIKTFEANLFNKQSDINYDNINNIIVEIFILKFKEESKTYEIITKGNKVKVTSKSNSKTNIDKLLNNSKKKR